ncbi:low molecular weight protein-tyrosine-phosphatase [Tepidimonas charontis]|uniref:protein-tyrosine-phosphatase n=1 Tax=Tepidimonas charontis TaxID=2267262 RepID=A0A554XAM0_9BURK|nr:low molecular weight protein-tyrosine-phosphatase [Tepidimonas charontis]TSE32882.1 Low molecular weight protein-tyrosine-phosphatase YfkJ [Tepidimonas charontis]
MHPTPAYHIVVFCMGNICRSPTAHAVLRHRLQQRGWHAWVTVDSAGTHAYHVGHAPDPRAQHHARLRGYDLSDLRARQLTPEDFARADLLLGMDWDNLALAEAACPPAHRRKLRRLAEFCRRHDSPVIPDPYYEGASAFEYVLDLVEDACDGLLDHVGRVLHRRGLALPSAVR